MASGGRRGEWAARVSGGFSSPFGSIRAEQERSGRDDPGGIRIGFGRDERRRDVVVRVRFRRAFSRRSGRGDARARGRALDLNARIFAALFPPPSCRKFDASCFLYSSCDARARGRGGQTRLG